MFSCPKGCTTAFFMWFPLLIYKLFKGIWLFISWILQTISGVPIYYCKPGYRIPAQILGTVGLGFLFFSIFSGLVILINSSHIQHTGNSLISLLLSIFILGGIGLFFLFICRILIRKGSI